VQFVCAFFLSGIKLGPHLIPESFWNSLSEDGMRAAAHASAMLWVSGGLIRDPTQLTGVVPGAFVFVIGHLISWRSCRRQCCGQTTHGSPVRLLVSAFFLSGIKLGFHLIPGSFWNSLQQHFFASAVLAGPLSAAAA
jgi:hypothetical protein